MKIKNIKNTQQPETNGAPSLSSELTTQRHKKLLPVANEDRERDFSIELKSKNCFKNFLLANGSLENVLVEGTVGKLQRVDFVEGILLEIIGTKGVLRIDLTREEIQNLKD